MRRNWTYKTWLGRLICFFLGHRLGLYERHGVMASCKRCGQEYQYCKPEDVR
jgi:hypothetical protein